MIWTYIYYEIWSSIYLKDTIKAYFCERICCSRQRLWVGYFIYFKLTRVFWYLMFLMNVLLQLKKLIGKAMCVFLFVFNRCSTSIKEIDRLIWKRMSNIYYWEELTFSEVSFSRKGNLKKVTNFEKSKRHSPVFRLQNCFFKNYFVREINKKLPENFQQKGWVFTDIMNVSLNILAKN